MGAAASSQSLPNSTQSLSELTQQGCTIPPAKENQSAMACGFSDFSLYPDRFSLSERRQTIGGYPAGSLSSSTSTSASSTPNSSTSSSTLWGRKRSTTICGETIETTSGGGAGWRSEKRRHYSSGSRQPPARYGAPFSDFSLYPDRYQFRKEDQR